MYISTTTIFSTFDKYRYLKQPKSDRINSQIFTLNQYIFILNNFKEYTYLQIKHTSKGSITIVKEAQIILSDISTEIPPVTNDHSIASRSSTFLDTLPALSQGNAFTFPDTVFLHHTSGRFPCNLIMIFLFLNKKRVILCNII